MNQLRVRIEVALLGHLFAWALCAILLSIDEMALIPAGAALVAPSAAVILSVGWLAWRFGTAITDTHAVLTDWHARRAARRTPARPLSLADYMPGASQPERVNRAA